MRKFAFAFDASSQSYSKNSKSVIWRKGHQESHMLHLCLHDFFVMKYSLTQRIPEYNFQSGTKNSAKILRSKKISLKLCLNDIKTGHKSKKQKGLDPKRSRQSQLKSTACKTD